MPSDDSPPPLPGEPQSQGEVALSLDLFPLGLSVIDEQGRILKTNSAASRLLGIPPSEHESRTLLSSEWVLFHPDGSLMKSDELPGMRALSENKLVASPEMGVLRPDGEIVWLSITAVPLSQDRVLITYGDVSESHRSKAILEARSRLADVAQRVSLDDLLRATLDEAEALTGSEPPGISWTVG